MTWPSANPVNDLTQGPITSSRGPSISSNRARMLFYYYHYTDCGHRSILILECDVSWTAGQKKKFLQYKEMIEFYKYVYGGFTLRTTYDYQKIS